MAARGKSVHLNLEKLARAVLAKPPAFKPGQSTYAHSEAGHSALLEKLRKERLELTDYEFRRRYADWL